MVLTDENFEKEIQKSTKPMLVDFWAAWCSPCTLLTPILDKLAEDVELSERFILVKVNVDEAPIISQKFGIDKIPTVILFKGEKPICGFIGLRSEDEIKKWLEENLK